MRTADLATASVLLLLGGVVVVDALRLGIGWGTDGPKSGFFPFWLAVLMIAACGGIVVQALRRTSAAPFVTRAQLAPVLKVLLPATALVVLTAPPGNIPGLGLYVASAVYIAVYMRWIGHHRWLTVAAVSIGVPIACFVIFELWFLVPMPKGPLEAWLGY
jgi:putative tricarboxylic transport membrane protein